MSGAALRRAGDPGGSQPATPCSHRDIGRLGGPAFAGALREAQRNRADGGLWRGSRLVLGRRHAAGWLLPHLAYRNAPQIQSMC